MERKFMKLNDPMQRLAALHEQKINPCLESKIPIHHHSLFTTPHFPQLLINRPWRSKFANQKTLCLSL
jgi:hypothetical protein